MKRASRWRAMVVGALSIGSVGPAMAQPVPASARDQQQVAEIRARLRKDPELRNDQIGVTVEGSVATLTGRVDSRAEKSDAARVALIPGVVGVDNRLEVGSPGAKQTILDSALTAKIKGKLTAQGLAEFSKVSVTTDKGGVVTLTGSVPDSGTALQVVEIVKNSEGVRRIENRMTIAPIAR